MFTHHKHLAGAVMALAFLVTACSSPSSGSEGVTDVSSEANSAAEALGIDLASCPTDATKPFGATVKVGNTIPQTGPVAPALGVIGPAMKEAFRQFNETSGLGATFELVQSDDAFTPDKALTATQTLLDKDGVDMMTGVIGTAQVAAVRGVLGGECVPLLPGVSGGKSANNPTEYPWTSAFTQPSALDARIIMASINENHPNGTNVAVLYANNESGKDYLSDLEKYAGKSKIIKTETIEATETGSPSSQITTLRSTGANVLIAVPTAAQCASTMQEVANQGWEADRYMTSVCASTTFDVAGAAADGWHVTTYVKDATRGEFVNDPVVVAAIESIKKASPNTPITTTTLGGFLYPQPFFEAAKVAAKSPLGLSRLGMMSAYTTLDFQPTLLMPGVRFKLDGLDDQVAIEASYLTAYHSDTKLFENVKLYDFEGQMTMG
ncbi:ABC transporter substrate-binding protein [Rhodococcus sp. WY5]|uniref:ABC transporter substrate-binding protein n=1 Tax=Rhodococcus sp. WY5 TaxID=2708349 RepID=UPI001BDEC05C|nr:ABC transporter substrate-binding protein [Rhodococcus sp. WY5]